MAQNNSACRLDQQPEYVPRCLQLWLQRLKHACWAQQKQPWLHLHHLLPLQLGHCASRHWLWTPHWHPLLQWCPLVKLVMVQTVLRLKACLPAARQEIHWPPRRRLQADPRAAARSCRADPQAAPMLRHRLSLLSRGWLESQARLRISMLTHQCTRHMCPSLCWALGPQK